MIEQQIEKLQRCVAQQNELAARLSKEHAPNDVTFTMTAISVVLGEVIDALSRIQDAPHA